MRRIRSFPFAVAVCVLALSLTGGCIGGRFDSTQTHTPGSDVDSATRSLVQGISDARAAKNLPPPAWVDELRPPAARGALGVARGDLSLKTAAHQSALAAVGELGRHVWAFATDCTDLSKFRPPAMALDGKTLLVAAAVASAPGNKFTVVLIIAEPGPSALRADQMGGGGGGTNPTLEAYAHPIVASGPCGETWPAAPSRGY